MKRIVLWWHERQAKIAKRKGDTDAYNYQLGRARETRRIIEEQDNG